MKRTPKRLLFAAASAAVLSCIAALIFMAGAANDDIDVETVTAKINYYYYDEEAEDMKGYSPYNSFVANMPKGSESITERCPLIPGYTPEIKTDGENFEISETVTLSFDEDNTTEVYYFPSNTTYQIKLLTQNLYDDDHSLADVIYSTGITGTKPVELRGSYRFPDDYSIESYRGKYLDEIFDGFTLVSHEPEEIAATGETVFSCYFERKYYNVEFDLGGGYGVSNMYVPYGYPLEMNVGVPSKAGYTFGGWEPELKKEVTKSITYTAKWNPTAAVNCSVIFKTADVGTADSPVYSYWGDLTITGLHAGTSLSIDDVIAQYKDRTPEICPSDEPDEYTHFVFDEAATRANNPESITIKGDNTSVVSLYYKRKTYSIRFAYARQELEEQAYISSETIDTQNSGYIFINNRAANDKAMRSETVTKKISGETLTGLELIPMSATETPVRWHFEKADDRSNAYHIYCEDGSGTKKYLYIGINEAGAAVGRGCAGARAFAENEEKPVIFAEQTTNAGIWMLYQTVNGKKWYLNDIKGDKGLASSSSYTDAGSQWKLCLNSEKEKTTGRIYISNRTTGSGYDNNYGTHVENRSVSWEIPVDRLPELNLPDDPRVKYSTYEKTFTEGSGSSAIYYSYRYHCITLTEEYGADIEDIWPADVLGRLNKSGTDSMYDFGSWSSNAFSIYRAIHGSTHSNIIGNYPTMSRELMIDYANNSDLEMICDSEGNEIGQTFYAWWGDYTANIGLHAFEVFYEAVDQQAADAASDEDKVIIDGVTYIRHTIHFCHCAHNSNTKISPFSYEGMLILPSEEYGYDKSHGEGHYEKYFTFMESGIPVQKKVIVTPFHYTRRRNDIYFESMGTAYLADDIKYKSIPYGKDISTFAPADPSYPDEIFEEGSYHFAGWYTSAQFFDEEHRFSFDNKTMPARPFKLFALWEPVTFNLTFYNDKSDYDNERRPLTGTSRTCRYGEYMAEDDIEAVESELHGGEFLLPDGITTAHLERMGWYYYKDNVLTSFVPETMTVSRDMKLFMKWTTVIPAEFEVSYVIKNSDTPIADPTNGFSFVGLTKTFKAKFEDQLYNEYSSHFYPYYNSQSVLLKSDAANNRIRFEYGYRNIVPYKVRYVELNDDGTEGSVLADDKLVADNTAAIVTEKFVPVAGYIPQNYYKSLMLTISDEYGDGTPDPKNIITFYYKRDEVNVPCRITYLIENDNGAEKRTIDGKTVRFSEASYIDDIGQRGTEEKARLLSFSGYSPSVYEIYESISSADGSTSVRSSGLNSVTAGQKTINFTLSSDMSVYGTELKIYYRMNSYPVKVIYTFGGTDIKAAALWYKTIKAADSSVTDDPESAVEYGSETIYTSVYKLSEPVRLNSIYEADAPVIDKFMVSGDERQIVVISDDDMENPVKNRISFVYKESKYVMYYYYAVLPDGFDTFIPPSDNPKLLSVNREMVERHTFPTHSVTAKLKESPYRFVGWYMDRDCTEPVPESFVSGSSGEVILPLTKADDDSSFYAKYEFITGTLVIEPVTDKPAGSEFEYVIKGTDTLNSHIELRIFITANTEHTITYLPIGHYTVYQGPWSWRFTPDKSEKNVIIYEDQMTRESFSNTLINQKWLAN